MINKRDSPIISLDKIIIWLFDGPDAHSIFEHEYLKCWKGKIILKEELINISNEDVSSKSLWTLVPAYQDLLSPFSIVRKVIKIIYL